MGPNQLNGPNVWLTRFLPLLRKAGLDAQALYLTYDKEVRCRFVEQLKRDGVPVLTCSLARFTATNVKRILEILSTDKPDIFCPNCSVCGYFAAPFLREAGVNTVGILHSDDPVYADLTELFLKGPETLRMSGVVAVSEYLHANILQEVPPTKLPSIHAPCGIPTPTARASHKEAPFQLIYTGRLVEKQKRISRVLDRLEDILGKDPKTVAVVYGSGAQKEQVKQRIEASPYLDRLKFGGVVDPDQVSGKLLESQALVLLSDYEGLSISLMESLACGVVPVVTATRSGTCDLLKDDYNCIVVDPDNTDAFVSAVKRLREQPSEWKRLSDNAVRSFQESSCAIESTVSLWADFLQTFGHTNPEQSVTVSDNLETALPQPMGQEQGLRLHDVRVPELLKGEADRKSYIWGAGIAGQLALQELRDLGIQPIAFLDSDPKKVDKKVEDLNVTMPSELLKSEERPFVWIASMYQAEIQVELETMGFSKERDFLSV